MRTQHMLSRRNFLLGSGALAAAASCQPPESVLRSVFGIGSAAAQSLELSSKAHLPDVKHRLLGYPINMVSPPQGFLDWRRRLAECGIGRFHYNNVGDPYKHSHIPFNTHDLEIEVIERFAAKFGFPSGKHWGFVSHSGTDSNMHGMYIGKTLLAARSGVTPKVYFTREAHYSIQILRDLMGLEWIVVGTKPDGSMDADDLARKLAVNPDEPALVVATIGTTFKGAVDDIDRIRDQLRHRDSYLHVDAALFGGYLPHTRFASDLHNQVNREGRTQRRYDSLAVSCHKFYGFPAPAGLFITTRQNFSRFVECFGQVHDPEYILQVPGTITCSRDAVKPAEFFYYSSDESFARQRIDAREMLNNASYLYHELRTHFSQLKPERADPRSNTVFFRKPAEQLVEKYSLATMQLVRDGERVDCAHIVVMPHANKSVLDQFLSDLQRLENREERERERALDASS